MSESLGLDNSIVAVGKAYRRFFGNTDQPDLSESVPEEKQSTGEIMKSLSPHAVDIIKTLIKTSK